MQLHRRDGKKSAARVSEARRVFAFCQRFAECESSAGIIQFLLDLKAGIRLAERKSRRFQAELLLAVGGKGEPV